MDPIRPLTRPWRTVRAPLLVVAAAGCGLAWTSAPSLAAHQEDGPEAAPKAAPLLRGIEETTGRFRMSVELDMAAAGVPGLELKLEGTSETQLLLGGQALLSVSQLEGVQGGEIITLLAARQDLGKLFCLTANGGQSAITYADGDVTGEGALVLVDPFATFRSSTMYVEDGGTISKFFLAPDWEQLSETRLVRTAPDAGDVLARLLSRPRPRAWFNRSQDGPDPAAHHAPEHERLAAFAGSFLDLAGDPEEPRFFRAQLVGNGRYLLGVAGAGDPLETRNVDEVLLLGFDSVREVHQLFRYSGKDEPVVYCEGAAREDGELRLRDPFGAWKVSASVAEDGGQRWTWTQARKEPVVVSLARAELTVPGASSAGGERDPSDRGGH